jgi:hypothetical protein
MALILTLLACERESPPNDPGCPAFDWSVHLHSSIYDEVFQAIPLPDGDMIVTGNNGGAVQIGTDGTRLVPAYGPRDGFVARLSPAGAVRWSHVIGGIHADQAGTVTLSNGGLWMALAASGYELLLDWEPLAGTGRGVEDPTGTSAFYIGFDLDGGLLGYQRLSPVTGQSARAVSTDEAGNRYVYGYYTNGVMSVGPWTHVAPAGRAFVASYDAAGTARWFTTVGGGSGNGSPTGMVVFDDHLLVALDDADRELTLQHGDTAPIPWNTGSMGLLALDLQTGLPTGAPDATSLYGSDSRSLEPGPDGTAILTGIAHAPGEWRDTATVLHPLSGFEDWTGPAVFGYRARLDSDGLLEEVDAWQPSQWFGSSATPGPTVVAGWRKSYVQGTGNDRIDWTTPVEGARDGVAALFDATGALQCAWMLGGAREQDAFDAAIDAEGGVWVVGKFIEQLVVRDPDGTVVTALETEENESDGFVLRFRPPGE